MPYAVKPKAVCTVCGFYRTVVSRRKHICFTCNGREWARDNIDKPSQQRNIERRRKNISENRQAILEAKNVPCTDCGKVYPSYVMDFDHRPGEHKSFTLANAAARKVETVIAEIAKCDVVCSNCHRIRTHDRGQCLVGLEAANLAIQVRMKGQVS